MSTYFISLPRTEAAIGLENLEELEKKFQFIYKIAVDGESAELCGLYDGNPLPDDADYLIVPFSSGFERNAEIFGGETFVNVLGSSKDKPEMPYTGLSWLEFYDYATNQIYENRVNSCVTDHYFYKGQGTEQKKCDDSYCKYCGNRKNLIGGHVIVSPKIPEAAYPSTLNNPVVGILPICMCHNKHDDGYMINFERRIIPIIYYVLSKEVYQSELDAAKLKKDQVEVK